jgi:hypothetical protein
MDMRRGIVHFFSLLSLAVCVATGGMWVRSHVVADQFSRGGAGWYVLINSDNGVVAYVTADEAQATGKTFGWRWTKAWGGSFVGGFDAVWGSSVSSYTAGTSAVRQRAWWISHWVIVAVTAVLPVSRIRWLIVQMRWLWNRKRRERLAKGLCPICGYDVRATPACCPECGTVGQERLQESAAS